MDVKLQSNIKSKQTKMVISPPKEEKPSCLTQIPKPVVKRLKSPDHRSSDNMSPIIFSENTSRKMQNPGKTANHQA